VHVFDTQDAWDHAFLLSRGRGFHACSSVTSPPWPWSSKYLTMRIIMSANQNKKCWNCFRLDRPAEQLLARCQQFEKHKTATQCFANRALCDWQYRADGMAPSSVRVVRTKRESVKTNEFSVIRPSRCDRVCCDVLNDHVILFGASSSDEFPMTLTLSVYQTDGERIGRNDSSHISLGSSSSPPRTTTLFVVFSVLFLTGCASDHPPKQHRPDRPFFDTPNPEDTLH